MCGARRTDRTHLAVGQNKSPVVSMREVLNEEEDTTKKRIEIVMVITHLLLHRSMLM